MVVLVLVQVIAKDRSSKCDFKDCLYEAGKGCAYIVVSGIPVIIGRYCNEHVKNVKQWIKMNERYKGMRQCRK